MPIREIFAAKGEGYFRDLEHEQLQRALAEGHAVISTGGGIVVREENRRLLRESGRFAVYLHGDVRTLHERITGDANSHISRPNLTNLGGGLEEIEYLLSIRDPLYREVAQLVVETGGRRPEEIAQEILRGCRERGLGG